MRWPEARSYFTPADDPAKNLWFVRDPAAIAAAKGLSVAPFYIEQESPAAAGGPLVGRLQPSLPNNHLQYALTWYALALVLAAVFVVWAVGNRRMG
jgi:surfeit locus 1 family protein